jgi:RNA recognition motif-containing protein
MKTTTQQTAQVSCHYLYLESSSLIVCNNRFRHHLSELFDVESITFNKVGPLRKYCEQGIIRLKSPIPTSSLPVSLVYRGKTLVISASSPNKALSFEKENTKKMYFGGANPRTSVETIKAFFSRFGPVSFCKMMQKPAMNGTRFGFIIFEERSSLEMILNSGPFSVEGYKLYVCEYTNNSQNRSRKQKKTDCPNAIVQENEFPVSTSGSLSPANCNYITYSDGVDRLGSTSQASDCLSAGDTIARVHPNLKQMGGDTKEEIALCDAASSKCQSLRHASRLNHQTSNLRFNPKRRASPKQLMIQSTISRL